jgi:hypothetical protein
MRTEFRLIFFLLKLALTVFVGLLIVFYLAQNRLLFQSTRDIYRTPQSVGWAFEEVRVNVGEHTTAGWWIPYPEDAKGAILFSHGNAGNIADRLESIGIFRDLGFDVLAYDYGGYGDSTGKPTEKRCYGDIRAMYDWLVNEKKISADRVILFGRSLGAGPTCALATEVTVAGVVIESTFTSVPDRGREIFPFLPVTLMSKNRFNNLSKVPSFLSPVLVVHSQDDTTIPFHHGKALFEAAKEPKSFLEIRGDHNEGFWMSGELYTTGLSEFFKSVLSAPSE